MRGEEIAFQCIWVWPGACSRDVRHSARFTSLFFISHSILRALYCAFEFLTIMHWGARKVLRQTAKHNNEYTKMLVWPPRKTCLSPPDAAYRKTLLLFSRNSRDGGNMFFGRWTHSKRFEKTLGKRFGKLLLLNVKIPLMGFSLYFYYFFRYLAGWWPHRDCACSQSTDSHRTRKRRESGGLPDQTDTLSCLGGAMRAPAHKGCCLLFVSGELFMLRCSMLHYIRWVLVTDLSKLEHRTLSLIFVHFK